MGAIATDMALASCLMPASVGFPPPSADQQEDQLNIVHRIEGRSMIVIS